MIRALMLMLVISTSVAAEQPETITLGMSSATQGPAKEIGLALSTGAQLYFERHNKSRKSFQVDLIHLNDGYEPLNTVANTRRFLEQHEVTALFGYMGTPTTTAVLDLVRKQRVPLLFPYTGAQSFRLSENEFIVHLRNSYEHEALAQAQYLKSKGAETVALLVQADEFGLEAGNSLMKAFQSEGLTITNTARFRRNSTDIAAAINLLFSRPVDAIALVGTYSPVSEFINLAHIHGKSPYYTAMSFTSRSSLKSQLKQSSSVMVTEVVADPLSCELKICALFREDIAKQGVTSPNRLHFEGYLNAYAATEIMEFCLTHSSRFIECMINDGPNVIAGDTDLVTLFKLNNKAGDNVYQVELN